MVPKKQTHFFLLMVYIFGNQRCENYTTDLQESDFQRLTNVEHYPDIKDHVAFEAGY